MFNGTDISSLPINERSNAGIVYGFQHPVRFKGTTSRELLSISLGSDDEDKLVNDEFTCAVFFKSDLCRSLSQSGNQTNGPGYGPIPHCR